MATGGFVVTTDEDSIPTKKYVKPAKPDLSSDARGMFSDLKKSMESTSKSTKGSSSGGGGVGYVPGSRNPFDPDSPLTRKKGGRVTKKVGTVKKNK